MKAKQVLNARSAFKQATHYLVVNHQLSPQEARARIMQEAMAKRAGLEEVARAVVAGNTVEYHYNTPIETSRCDG
jgi:AmiR/NasT family two-component response regulator